MLKIVATALALLCSATAFAGERAPSTSHAALADPFGFQAFHRAMASSWGHFLGAPVPPAAPRLVPGERSFGPVDDHLIHAAMEKLTAEYPGARIDFAPPGLALSITNRGRGYGADNTDVPVTPNGVIRLALTVGNDRFTREVKTTAGGTRLMNAPSRAIKKWDLPIVERARAKARLQFPEALNVLRDTTKPIGPNGEIPLRISYPYRDPRGQFNVTVTTKANGTEVGS